MAAVAFTKAELKALLHRYIGESDEEDAEIDNFFEAMERTGRPMREVSTTMEHAADLLQEPDVLGLFARDGQVVTDPFDAIWLADYVNVGDSYGATILYDREAHTFFIQSYGDFIEGWEAEHPPAPQEDVCVSCGEQFPVDELEYSDNGTEATCRDCLQREQLVTWEPNEDQPLITVLRSIDGLAIAVHLYAWEWETDFEGPPPWLAFSVMQTEDHFIALNPGRIPTRKKYGKFLPSYRTWASVDEAFTKKQHTDLYVASSDSKNINVGIEREMFERLRVALDAFFTTGGKYQPVKELLKVPPVLWTCGQINYIVWDEGEPGHGMAPAVEAFVAEFAEGISGPESGPVQSDLSIWSASGEYLAELIEDGFIKFGVDKTVRDYLKHIGVCRER